MAIRHGGISVLAVALGLAWASAASYGQVLYGTAGADPSTWTPYTQNFDTLSATGVTPNWTPWTDNSTLPGWYAWQTLPGTGQVPTVYRTGDGTSNAGALYSFGTAGAADRALGSIGSGTPGDFYYGLRLTNNSGITLNTFTLTYDGEQWRQGGQSSGSPVVGTVQSLVFSYSGNATGIATGTYTNVDALGFTSPVATVANTGNSLDGNAAANRVAGISAQVSGLAWAPGTDLWIRWWDRNDVGNDHALALDNLTFTAAVAPPNHSVLLVNQGKGPIYVSAGRTLKGAATNLVEVTLSNTGTDPTHVNLTGTAGGTGQVASPLAAGASTPLKVGITSAGTGAAGVLGGSDLSDDNANAGLLSVTGENVDDNQTPAQVNISAHIVQNRYVNNVQDNAGVPFGKLLVGASKTVIQVPITTIDPNFQTTPARTVGGQITSNELTKVSLLQSTTLASKPTLNGFANVSMAAGSAAEGDISWVDNPSPTAHRDVTVTAVRSHKSASTAEYAQFDLRNDDEAAGCAPIGAVSLSPGRMYVAADIYQPAGLSGDGSVAGVATVKNAPPSDNTGTTGLRADAAVIGTSLVSTLNGFALADATFAVGAVIPGGKVATTTPPVPATPGTLSGNYTFNSANKLPGVYTGSLVVLAQNDPTITGATPHDLPDTTVPLTATVPTDTLGGSGAYDDLTAGTLTSTTQALGNGGAASLKQTGGVNTVGTLTLGIAGGGSGTYQLQGGTLNATTIALNSGSFTETAGTLNAGGFTTSGTVVLGGPQTWAAGATLNVAAGSVTLNTDAGPAATGAPGSATLSITVGFLAPAPSPSPAGSAIVPAGPTLTLGSTQHLAGLTVGANTVVTVTPSATAGGKVLLTDALTISLTTPGTAGHPGTYVGSLNLANNDLAVSYTAATHAAVLAAVTDMVRAAAAVPTDGSSTTPTWTGKGITSSSVQAYFSVNGPAARTLGVYDNNYNGNGTPYFSDGTLDGVSLGATPADQANHVIVKYLYVGDLNGDGLVNGADYNVIDNAFVRQARGDSFVINWQTGDLNGDGLLNGVDYNVIDNAQVKWVASGWNVTGPPVPPPPSPAPGAGAGAGAGAGDESASAVGAAPAVVPEPGTLALLALGGLLVLRRRR